MGLHTLAGLVPAAELGGAPAPQRDCARQGYLDVVDRIAPGGKALNQILATIIGLDLRSGSFRYADFTNCLLYGANFRHADLDGSSFEGAQLDLAQLREAHLEKASFKNSREQHTSLKKASLRAAQLKNADLTNVDLTDADLTGASVDGTDFTDTIWTGAKIKSVDLTTAKSVDWAKVQEACGDARTKVKTGVIIKQCAD